MTCLFICFYFKLAAVFSNTKQDATEKQNCNDPTRTSNETKVDFRPVQAMTSCENIAQ